MQTAESLYILGTAPYSYYLEAVGLGLGRGYSMNRGRNAFIFISRPRVLSALAEYIQSTQKNPVRVLTWRQDKDTERVRIYHDFAWALLTVPSEAGAPETYTVNFGAAEDAPEPDIIQGFEFQMLNIIPRDSSLG